MNKIEQKNYNRNRRHHRIRAKVKGTPDRPRLAVFRSARHIVAQLIDDTKGVTIAAASDIDAKTGNKLERATATGKLLAARAKEKGVTKAVFDRGGFLYAGRVRALADAARESGLLF